MTGSPLTLDLQAPLAPLSPVRAARGAILGGLVLIAVTFGGVAGWAALAPLHSAALAPGVVVVQSYRKTVQHLEGGIVREILVKEGSAVKEGDVLLRLDGTGSGSTVDRLRQALASQLALEARLVAERDGARTITPPARLAALLPGDIAVMRGERQTFVARRQALAGQVEVLENRIAQSREEIAGHAARIRAAEEQAALIDDELRGVQTLYDKGLTTKPRLLALKRRAAEIGGERGQDQAMIARAEQEIGEARLQIIDLRNSRMEEISRSLQGAQREIADLNERLVAAEAVHGRADIVAPVSGTVVGLKVHTLGGVIAPQDAVMDIVPGEDGLVVEARVSPDDVDSVRTGQAAEIRFPAFSSRTTPTARGTLTQVSADRLVDTATGLPYYLGRIEIAPDSLHEQHIAALQPGMRAEVMIMTKSRTALDYFLTPLEQIANRAFREN